MGGTVFNNSGSSAQIYTSRRIAKVRCKGRDENFTGTKSQVIEDKEGVYLHEMRRGESRRKRAQKLALRKLPGGTLAMT